MDSQKLSNLSKEELISLVVELDDKLNQQNELMNTVRERKHDYCDEDFGLVVSVPVDELLKELLCNPQAFSIEEKRKLIETCTSSIEMRGAFECLGWPIGKQISKVKKKMIPLIRSNVDFFSYLLGKNIEYQNKKLVGKLRRSLDETETLCSNLEKIELFEYGEPQLFNLKAAIKEAFNSDDKNTGSSGEKPIYLVDYYWDVYSGTMVEMNRDSFRTCFLGNIIKNLHDHAFKDFDESSTKPSLLYNNITWWKRIFLFVTAILKRDKERSTGTTISTVQEKRVRISLKKDKKNEHRMNLVIENNGNMFYGDVNDVFEKGVGEGNSDHLGLYNAKRFLKTYGATIKMFTDPDNEEGFKVGFQINLPIL